MILETRMFQDCSVKYFQISYVLGYIITPHTPENNNTRVCLYKLFVQQTPFTMPNLKKFDICK